MNKPAKKILLATDLSEASHAAALQAIEMAKAQEAALTLLHVFDVSKWLVPVPFFTIPNAGQWAQEHIDVALLKAQQMLQELNDLYGGNAQVLLLEGKPGKTIVETAEAQGTELIVLGTHGHTGFEHVLLGSVAGYVTRRAHCSVLTIKTLSPESKAAVEGEGGEEAAWEIKRILVPIDFSKQSREALKEAVVLARDNDATLQVLHTIDHLYEPSVYEEFTKAAMGENPRPEIESKTQETLGEWVADLIPSEIPSTISVVMGGAADRISHYASTEKSDLIVMATHGHTGFKRFLLGSVTEQVLRYVHCPVLILRHPREAM